MRDKSEVLAGVRDALLAGDLERASAMAIADYPFIATTNAGRAYSEVQSLRIFRRDFFLIDTRVRASFFPARSGCCRRLCPPSFRRIRIGKGL